MKIFDIKLKIITKYVLQEFIPTFLIAFFFFFVMFIINHILLYIKPLFEKDVPFDLIAMLLITAMPMYMIFCLPFGIMLSTLMTMGRFSSDNEIVAFRACGFNIMKIFTPIFITGLVLTILCFMINDSLLPYSLQKQRETFRKIMYLKPTLDFKSKTVKRYFGKILITDIVKDTSIEGLIIIDDSDNQKRIISTKEAKIGSPKYNKNAVEITMRDAMIQFDNRDRPNEFNYGYTKLLSYFISFDTDDDSGGNISGNEKTTGEIVVEVNKYKSELNNDKKSRKQYLLEKNEEIKSLTMKNQKYYLNKISNYEYMENLKVIDENINEINSLKKVPIRNNSLNYNLLELYKKFALPLACIIFTIFAAPIGIYSRRAGYSIGFILGLFISAFYWFTYYAGQFLGIRNVITPFLAIFLPNMIFLALGIYFLIKRLKE
jgi:lipopolysaccharide export system permease protein